MMRKKFINIGLGIAFFLSTSVPVLADSPLDSLISTYFLKRYHSGHHYSVDFEQVQGIYFEWQPDHNTERAAGTHGDIIIALKNGSHFEIVSKNYEKVNYVYGDLINAFDAFKASRRLLLQAAAGDLSSVVTLKIVFQ